MIYIGELDNPAVAPMRVEAEHPALAMQLLLEKWGTPYQDVERVDYQRRETYEIHTPYFTATMRPERLHERLLRRAKSALTARSLSA